MRYFVGAGMFFIAFLFQLMAIVFFRRMKAQVNEKLAPDLRIPAVGLSLLRSRVIRLHREFFPESSVRRKFYVCYAIEYAAFFVALAFIIRVV